LERDLADIIEGCKQNDPGSQEKVYRLFAPKMYAISLRYAGSKEDAKDLLQDGFVKVFEYIGQYAGKGSFEGWIRKIIINTALEKLRKPVSAPLEEYLPDLIEEPVSEAEDIGSEVLLEMVSELSPRYRAVFNLYVLDENSHEEISKILGISEGTSKSNLSRAREILRNRIIYYLKEKEKISLKKNETNMFANKHKHQ